MDHVGRALRPGELRSRRAGIDVDLVLLAHDRLHRERHRRGRHIHNDIDAVLIEPLTDDRRADVRLVLMVGDQHIDGEPFRRYAKILERLAHAGNGGRPRDVAINAGLVIHHPDLDDRGLGTADARRQPGRRGDGGPQHSDGAWTACWFLPGFSLAQPWRQRQECAGAARSGGIDARRQPSTGVGCTRLGHTNFVCSSGVGGCNLCGSVPFKRRRPGGNKQGGSDGSVQPAAFAPLCVVGRDGARTYVGRQRGNSGSDARATAPGYQRAQPLPRLYGR